MILRPLEGSIAEKSGIQPLDLVLSVNNEKISTSEEFIKKISENNPFTLEVERNSEKIFLEITPEDGKI